LTLDSYTAIVVNGTAWTNSADVPLRNFTHSHVIAITVNMFSGK